MARDQFTFFITLIFVVGVLSATHQKAYAEDSEDSTREYYIEEWPSANGEGYPKITTSFSKGDKYSTYEISNKDCGVTFKYLFDNAERKIVARSISLHHANWSEEWMDYGMAGHANIIRFPYGNNGGKREHLWARKDNREWVPAKRTIRPKEEELSRVIKSYGSSILALVYDNMQKDGVRTLDGKRLRLMRESGVWKSEGEANIDINVSVLNKSHDDAALNVEEIGKYKLKHNDDAFPIRMSFDAFSSIREADREERMLMGIRIHPFDDRLYFIYNKRSKGYSSIAWQVGKNGNMEFRLENEKELYGAIGLGKFFNFLVRNKNIWIINDSAAWIPTTTKANLDMDPNRDEMAFKKSIFLLFEEIVKNGVVVKNKIWKRDFGSGEWRPVP